jgi:hypothetical protein
MQITVDYPISSGRQGLAVNELEMKKSSPHLCNGAHPYHFSIYRVQYLSRAGSGELFGLGELFDPKMKRVQRMIFHGISEEMA